MGFTTPLMESYSNAGNLITQEGRIDFVALDEFYRNNQVSVLQMGGKSSLIMSTFCQLNAFNLDNASQIRQLIRVQEADFAQVLHQNQFSAENKFQVVANKISQMDQTTISAVTDIITLIAKETNNREEKFLMASDQFHNNNSHFNKMALQINDLKEELQLINAKQISMKEENAQPKQLVASQLLGINEAFEGFIASQEIQKNITTAYAKQIRELKMVTASSEAKTQELEERMFQMQTSVADILCNLRQYQNESSLKFSGADRKLNQSLTPSVNRYCSKMVTLPRWEKGPLISMQIG